MDSRGKSATKKLFIALLIMVFSAGKSSEVVALEQNLSAKREEVLDMKLTSPEFENNKFIPKKFTCEGEDISPTLIIEGIPQEAKSLALIVDDPDAPMGTWVHWVVYDMDVISRIDEDTIPGKQGVNDFGRKNYGGPCPPSGTHRYFFKVYALDKKLGLEEGASKKILEKEMQGHILGSAQLVGLYKKGTH